MCIGKFVGPLVSDFVLPEVVVFRAMHMFFD